MLLKRAHSNERRGKGGEGGGVLPYISHIGMCRPKGLGFCAVLV